MRKFPSGQWGRQRLQFFPAPFRAPLRAFAALVFPWMDGRVLIADIEGRGWCIPSGRVEPYETSLDAAKREAIEEAGGVLTDLQYIGCYHISERREVRWADCFVARVERLCEIGMTEESRGRKLVTLEELPAIYHLWNPLTERVFEHSKEIFERSLRHATRKPSDDPCADVQSEIMRSGADRPDVRAPLSPADVSALREL